MGDPMLNRLRAAIGFGLGLGVVGCGDRTVGGDSGAGTGEGDAQTTAPGSTSTSVSTSVSTTMSTTVSPPSTSTSTSISGSDSGDDNDNDDANEPVQFDMGEPPKPRPLTCDDPRNPPPVQGQACELGEGADWAAICQPADPSGACGPLTGVEAEKLESCIGVVDSCFGFYDQCGPLTLEDGSCCYWGDFGQICPGRPFTVRGEARVAAADHDTQWCDADSPTPTAPAHLSDTLAQAWRYDALHEHAAVASFSRFALQLLAMAAPARLVEGALRAALDEREHAGLFFALAQHYGGQAWGPGPLCIEAALQSADDPVHVVTSTIQEGCIAETISAMQLQQALENAEDPALRAALARVLAQEQQHVELAWSFVAWAYERGDARLRAAVAAAFEQPSRSVPAGPNVGPGSATDAQLWRQHGRLTDADQLDVARRAIEDAIAPAAALLLGDDEHRVTRHDPVLS